MNKAIKYRLYPTTEQATMFAKTFGCCRKVYNLMLADKIAYYKANGKMLATTPAMYKKDYPYLKEVDSLALANEQLHLQTAYKNFFRDKKIGFPKFKSAKHSRKSYTTNNQKGTITVFDNAIKFPKVGRVKAKIHRQPLDNWKIKSATISQDSDGKFYVSVLFEYEKIVTSVVTQKHTSNQRLDYLHKQSTKIANSYDIVCVETLDMKAMSNKGFGNGKATLDNGYGMFLNMLEYKLADRGKYFIKVDKWYPSSQLCSCCGKQKKLTLADRMYKCDCGLAINRDHNAAINIKNEGLRLLKSA